MRITTVALGFCAAVAAACATAGEPGTPAVKTDSPSAVARPLPRLEEMEQGVLEPCVYCQVLYRERLAAHCPHCRDRRNVFRPARMMDAETAAAHLGEAKERCERLETEASKAGTDARRKMLLELRRCFVGLLRDTLTYGVGGPKPMIDRIHALDAELGAAGTE